MPTLLFCQIRFVDYLNGMWYMICLPSLLCGMAVSVEDIRARRIPRMWIAVGCLAQVIVDITYALSVNSLFLALQALLFAALSAVLQCALALIKPGALGFGDVTTTLLIGLAVGMFGLFPVVFWWFAISVLGLLWLAIWTRFDPQKHTRFAGKTPFAPTIVVAGAISHRDARVVLMRDTVSWHSRCCFCIRRESSRIRLRFPRTSSRRS